jgi:putative endonuclease
MPSIVPFASPSYKLDRMEHSPSIGILRGAWIGAQTSAMRRLAAIAHRRSAMPQHLLTGERGELEALFHLRQQGYIVVARRWRSAKLRGDLDLIAWDGPTLCFIEIKTRSQLDAVPAEAAVDHDKQQTLQNLARSYIRRLPSDMPQPATRFDVLSIYLQAAEPSTEGLPNSTAPHDKTHREPYSTQGTRPQFVLHQGAFSWA